MQGITQGIQFNPVISEDKMSKKDTKMMELGKAADFMRKAADIIDKIAGAKTSEGDETKQIKKKRICD